MLLAAGPRTHMPGLWRPFGGMGVSARALQRGKGKTGVVECSGTLSSVLGKLRQGREGGRTSCFSLHCGFQQRRFHLRTSASDADELSGGNPCLDGEKPSGPVQRAPPWLREGVIDVSLLLLSTGGCNQRANTVGWCKGVCPTLQRIWVLRKGRGGCSASGVHRSEARGVGGGHFHTCLFAAPFQGTSLFILPGL